MRIGINILYLVPDRVGGTETYARELLGALTQVLAPGDSLVVYASSETAPTFQGLDEIEIVRLPFYSRYRALRMIIEQTVLPIRCVTDKIDVLFSLGYSAPFFHPCPSIVTIHDLNWHYHPEDFSRVNRWLWKVITTLSARTADRVITDSKASYTSICAVLGTSKSKVTPVLHGTPAKVKPVGVRKGKYILTVVAGYPHKNLPTLLTAFSHIAQKHADVDLVICGLSGRSDDVNAVRIKELGLESRVDILGYVTRGELAGLYRDAQVFVFPSAYEGFGYPVVEAMSYGTPVISSNAYSLEEVVGPGGILVDPYDHKAFAAAIDKILSSPRERERWIRKGGKRAGELQWEVTAKRTLAVLRDAGKVNSE